MVLLGGVAVTAGIVLMVRLLGTGTAVRGRRFGEDEWIGLAAVVLYGVIVVTTAIISLSA